MDYWEDWQKVYQHGIMVIWPPDEIRKIVNAQRRAFDPESAAVCETHITLTQPLLNPLNDSERKQIQEIVRGFTAFDIQYGPVKSFLPYPCIWYEIQPVSKILDLREALHQTGFFNLSLRHTDGFIPHMTITEGLSGPAVDETLLGIIEAESKPGSFICQEITFIIPDEAFCFKVTDRLSLNVVSQE